MTKLRLFAIRREGSNKKWTCCLYVCRTVMLCVWNRNDWRDWCDTATLIRATWRSDGNRVTAGSVTFPRICCYVVTSKDCRDTSQGAVIIPARQTAVIWSSFDQDCRQWVPRHSASYNVAMLPTNMVSFMKKVRSRFISYQPESADELCIVFLFLYRPSLSNSIRVMRLQLVVLFSGR